MDKENWKSLIDDAPFGVVLHDGVKIEYANQSYANLFGYTLEELVSLTFDKIIHPDDYEKAAAYRKARLNNQYAPEQYEIKCLKKDGSVIWIFSQVKIVLIGNEKKFFVSAIDVTEKVLVKNKQKNEMKRSLQDNKQKNSMIEIITENIPIGIWQTNENGELIFANSSFCLLFEKSFDEICDLEYLKYIHKDDLYKRNEQCINAYQGQSGEFEFRIFSTDNKIKWIKTKYNPIVVDGKYKGIVGIAIDSTNEKEILPALLALKKELSDEKYP